jgi:hypothetical protein
MTAAQLSPTIRSPRLSPTSAPTQRPAPAPIQSPRLAIIPTPPNSSSFTRRAREAQKALRASPLFATLTHSLSCKSFACHSYAITRDMGVSSFTFRLRFRCRCSKSFRIRSYEKFARNPFRMCSYKKHRGVGVPRQTPYSSPLFRPSCPGFVLAIPDTSCATWAYPIHPMSIARSGVQVHG